MQVGSEALCCRHRLQIAAFVSNNHFKRQRKALVGVDDGVSGGGCRNRDICHSPQSLTPILTWSSLIVVLSMPTFRLRTELQLRLSLFVHLAQRNGREVDLIKCVPAELPCLCLFPGTRACPSADFIGPR